jgi:PKD repeat protein
MELESTGNSAPTADLTANTTSFQVGDTVEFNGSGSSDSDGSITDFSWNFGDGNTASGQTVTHQYESTGTYTVDLTVTDNGSATDTASTTITVETNESYVTDVPPGLAVGLANNPDFDPSSKGVKRGSTEETIFGPNNQDRIAAGLETDFSSNVSALAVDAGANRNGRKSYLHLTSTISAVQSKNLYIPRKNQSGKVRICPDASSLAEVNTSCGSGFNISTGETINGVSLSEVSLAGYDYYKAAGITGTGGLEYNTTTSSSGGDDGGSDDGGSTDGSSGGTSGGTDSGSADSDTEDQDSGSNETVVHSWKLRKPTQLGLSEGLTVGSSGRFRTAVQVVNNGEDNVSIQVRCRSDGPACGWVTTLPTTVNVQSGGSRRVVVEGRVSPNASSTGFVNSITSPPSYPFTVEAVDQSEGVDGVSESVDMTVKVSSGYDVLTKPIQSTTISAGGPGVGVPNLVWALLAAVSWLGVFYLGVENIVQREKMPRSRYGTTAVIFVLVLLAI